MNQKVIKIALIILTALSAKITRAQNDAAAAAQHKLLGMDIAKPADAPHNPDTGAAWFPKAGLGMFIHWGAIASYGGGDISWCMMANKSWNNDATLKPPFYYSLMEKWDPQKYNPDALMRMAKAAGFQYAVITTKHHDGYTLWPSKYGDLGTHTKMHHRDLVKPYVDACRKYGLKVGFYYSPPDWWFDRDYRNWSFDGNVKMDFNHQVVDNIPAKPADHDEKRKKLVAGQIRELLTQYGKIDLLWFDGGNAEISNDEVRTLQPGIVINRRNAGTGDYGDSEGALPDKRFQGWFETCKPVWPSRWWSHVPCSPYIGASGVLTDLVKLRTWGGNLLANMAPLGDGAVPSQAISAMKEMAAWMKHSAESVTDVESGNYPEQSTIPVTVRENTLYAFALPGYMGEMNVTAKKVPQKVYMLRTKVNIPFHYRDGKITFSIPPAYRTLLPDVVRMDF